MACLALILLAHGSKDPKWCKSFENLAVGAGPAIGPASTRRLGETGEARQGRRDLHLQLAYMDLVEPSLFSVTKQLSNNGIKKIKILPLFMSSGGHIDKDIPKLVKELKVKFPSIDFEILPPIGEHPKVVSSMKAIIKEYAQEI